MATLTGAQLDQVVTYWADHNFVRQGTVASYNKDDLRSAAASIDSAFDTTITQAQNAGFGNMTIIQAFNANIPSPFNTATLQQKINLACNVLEKRAGLI